MRGGAARRNPHPSIWPNAVGPDMQPFAGAPAMGRAVSLRSSPNAVLRAVIGTRLLFDRPKRVAGCAAEAQRVVIDEERDSDLREALGQLEQTFLHVCPGAEHCRYAKKFGGVEHDLLVPE